MQLSQAVMELGADGNAAIRTVLGYSVAYGESVADALAGRQDHWPLKPRNFAGAQARFEAK
jgi:hypothetical protein